MEKTIKYSFNKICGRGSKMTTYIIDGARTAFGAYGGLLKDVSKFIT